MILPKVGDPALLAAASSHSPCAVPIPSPNLAVQNACFCCSWFDRLVTTTQAVLLSGEWAAAPQGVWPVLICHLSHISLIVPFINVMILLHLYLHRWWLPSKASGLFHLSVLVSSSNCFVVSSILITIVEKAIAICINTYSVAPWLSSSCGNGGAMDPCCQNPTTGN